MSRWIISLGLIVALYSAAHGQQAPVPQVGYAFPPGGQQGSTVEILLGGQRLANMNAATVSGDGVTASIVKYYKPTRNLMKEQREEMQDRFRERRFELTGKREKPGGGKAERKPDGTTRQADPESVKPVELPPHPLLDKIPSMSLRELEHAQVVLLGSNRMQQNRQLADLLTVKLSVASDAKPGLRELRLHGRDGITNPILIDVDGLQEFSELEPNNTEVRDPALAPPFVFNGQLLPGDVDRFRFRAIRGRTYSIRADGRSLIPFVADAVPGWIQLTLSLRDAQGREMAYADDRRFDPDPQLQFVAEADGEYEVVVRDALYRGREDFVYRVAVEESGKSGNPQRWHSEQPPVVPTQGSLSKMPEKEPNNGPAAANRSSLPVIVKGCIQRAGDGDWFRFEGSKGQSIVLDVVARREGSPMDSVLRLWDASGNLLSWNDDWEEKQGHLFRTGGLQTHAADSRLHYVLPANGAYFVSVADAQQGAGPEFRYQLRISEPIPDFALKVVPSGIALAAGGRAVLTVHAFREDGFDGEIALDLIEPAGFILESAVIPAGANRVDVTLVAPMEAPQVPVELALVGKALVGQTELQRHALPADDCMQAFLYRHLVPARQALVAILPRKQAATGLSLPHDGPIRILKNGKTVVRLLSASKLPADDATVELKGGPAGVKVEGVEKRGNELLTTLTAEGDDAKPGAAANLVFEIFLTRTPPKKGPVAPPKTRVSGGLFPATPFIIVATNDPP